MRYLGIDFGTKRVGLALSDEAGTMGFPHAIVPNDGRLIDLVRDLIVRKEVGTVVIGRSHDFSGADNPVAEKARTFAQQLERICEVPVEWESELFTTQEARRDPEGVHGGNRQIVDASAAALILTSYLSRTHSETQK